MNCPEQMRILYDELNRGVISGRARVYVAFLLEEDPQSQRLKKPDGLNYFLDNLSSIHSSAFFVCEQAALNDLREKTDVEDQRKSILLEECSITFIDDDLFRIRHEKNSIFTVRDDYFEGVNTNRVFPIDAVDDSYFVAENEIGTPKDDPRFFPELARIGRSARSLTERIQQEMELIATFKFRLLPGKVSSNPIIYRKKFEPTTDEEEYFSRIERNPDTRYYPNIRYKENNDEIVVHPPIGYIS